MNKKLKILLIAIGTIIILVGGVFMYVNIKKTDYLEKKSFQTFTFQELNNKLENDTSQFLKLRDKLITINAEIKKIIKDSSSISIELGDSTTLSSVVCQFDDRHLNGLYNLKEGNNVSLKGILTGFEKDDLGIGNKIDLTSCILNK